MTYHIEYNDAGDWLRVFDLFDEQQRRPEGVYTISDDKSLLTCRRTEVQYKLGIRTSYSGDTLTGIYTARGVEGNDDIRMDGKYYEFFANRTVNIVFPNNESENRAGTYRIIDGFLGISFPDIEIPIFYIISLEGNTLDDVLTLHLFLQGGPFYGPWDKN
jgi:hypothetical protein